MIAHEAFPLPAKIKGSFQLSKIQECSICTEPILLSGNILPIWVCRRSCKSIFHLSCVRAWAASTIVNSTQFSCPNCRCSLYNSGKDIEGLPRCFCGKKEIPIIRENRISGSLLDCGAVCGSSRTGCAHPCPKQCHRGPCPPCSLLGSPEPCVTGPPYHSALRQRRCGSALEDWCCDEPCPRIFSKCFLQSHHCTSMRCHPNCEECPELISLFCECASLQLSPSLVRCSMVFEAVAPRGHISCQRKCDNCDLVCHPGSISCLNGDGGGIVPTGITPLCVYYPPHMHDLPCRCGKKRFSISCTTIKNSEFGIVRSIIAPEDCTPICDSVCNGKFSSCGRHVCNRKCCPLLTTEHITCTMVCNRRLSCGKSTHRCTEPCHPGRSCRPCPRLSYPDYWECPCGKMRVDGPLGCTWVPPTCPYSCNRRITLCGHYSEHPCHSGDCPACLQPVFPRCAGCDRLTTFTIPCMFSQQSTAIFCGRRCNKPFSDCSHRCAAKCHPSDIKCLPCNQPCELTQNPCKHPCSRLCHSPLDLCSCSTSVVKQCPCGRVSQTILCQASSNVEVSCEDSCLVAQRAEALASIFNNSGETVKKAPISVLLQTWPSLAVENFYLWSKSHVEYIMALEHLFAQHISVTAEGRKRWVDLPPAGPIKRSMTMLIAQVYHLATIELDVLQRGSVRFGFPDEGVPSIPQILLSEAILLYSYYDIKNYISTSGIHLQQADSPNSGTLLQSACDSSCHTAGSSEEGDLEEQLDPFIESKIAYEQDQENWVTVTPRHKRHVAR